MERLSTGAGNQQDPIVALLDCGAGSTKLDQGALPRRRGRPPIYPDLFTRLKANCEINEFTGCWEWVGYKDRWGYPKVTMRVNGIPTGLYAHRVMLELTTGYYFPYDEAGHLCDNPACINPHHLEIQTTTFNLSERKVYTHRNYKACMIPCLFPIEGWTPPQSYKPLDTSQVCPF